MIHPRLGIGSDFSAEANAMVVACRRERVSHKATKPTKGSGRAARDAGVVWSDGRRFGGQNDSLKRGDFRKMRGMILNEEGRKAGKQEGSRMRMPSGLP